VSAAASQLGELNPKKKRRKESKAALLAKAEAKQQGSTAGDAAAEVQWFPWTLVADAINLLCY
jgi:hypothetical protein